MIFNKDKSIKIKKVLRYKTGIAMVLIILGIVLNLFNIGVSNLNFFSLGSCFIYIGFITILLATSLFAFKRECVIDERNVHVGNISMKIAFMSYVLFSFLFIILDSIFFINIKLSQFLSFFLCLIIIIYWIAYKIIEKRS